MASQHRKDAHNYGAQSIYFPAHDKTIALNVKAALFTFSLEKPTMEECLEALEGNGTIIDVSEPNWNPQEHTDDVTRVPPPVKIQQAVQELLDTEDETMMMMTLAMRMKCQH